jgi:ribonuclease VapC
MVPDHSAIVLDSSAIVAIHLREPGYERLVKIIGEAEIVLVGAPTLVETALVLTARAGQDARPVIGVFLRRIQAEIIPFQDEHFDAAITAFLRFGRGRHAAGLNFGDCLAYAVSAVAGMPLLCTGNDFAKTDLALA